MQFYTNIITVRRRAITYRMLLAMSVSIFIILAACGQPSTPVVNTSNQPIADVPAVLVGDLLMPSDELGVVVDENLKVLQIEIGSAAEQSGIQVGDILESLEGISFKEKEKVKEKIREPKEGKKFKLKLKRNDKDITLDITPAPPKPKVDAPTPTPVFAPQGYF